MAQYDPTTFQMTQFNTTLCECTLDGTSCIQGFFCPWCTTAQNYNMLVLNQPSMDTCMCLVTACIDIGCGTGGLAHGVAAVMTRNRARARFGITPDEGCCEVIKGFCCSPCSDCQVYRELSVRGLWPGGICVSTPFVKAGLVLPPMQTMDPRNPHAQPLLPFPVHAQPLQAYPVQGYPTQPGFTPQPQPGYPPQHRLRSSAWVWSSTTTFSWKLRSTSVKQRQKSGKRTCLVCCI